MTGDLSLSDSHSEVRPTERADSRRAAAVAPALDGCIAGYLNQTLDMPETGMLTLAQLDLLLWIGEHAGPVRWQDIRAALTHSAASPWRNLRYLVRRGLLRQCRRHSSSASASGGGGGGGNVSNDLKPHRYGIETCFVLSATGRSLLLSLRVSESRYQGMLLNQLSSEEQATLTAGARLILRELG